MKPGVGTQSVQPVVCVQVNGQEVGPIVVRAGEPLEGRVLVSKTGIDDGDVVRSDVSLLGQFFQVADDVVRFGPISKRGGAAFHVNLEDTPELAGKDRDREIITIDEALDSLAEIDPRKAKVIELRFFGGLSVEETAEVLKISAQSVMRDWKMAKSWLLAELAR